MNAVKIAFLAGAIIFSTILASAYDTDGMDDASSPESGMEVRKVGEGVNVLLPQGARMQRRNNSTSVEESSDQYAARNFTRINERLKNLEDENKILTEEIKYLRSKLTLVEKSADNDTVNPPTE
ncbi:MAG: hypothetical protein PHS46_00205 [Candidatus Omnitrophica bacterium]|jgi:hypothetical protein|nr:hypothetical protein [Candidatus Omnitrophota bacterium]